MTGQVGLGTLVVGRIMENSNLDRDPDSTPGMDDYT